MPKAVRLMMVDEGGSVVYQDVAQIWKEFHVVHAGPNGPVDIYASDRIFTIQVGFELIDIGDLWCINFFEPIKNIARFKSGVNWYGEYMVTDRAVILLNGEPWAAIDLWRYEADLQRLLDKPTEIKFSADDEGKTKRFWFVMVGGKNSAAALDELHLRMGGDIPIVDITPYINQFVGKGGTSVTVEVETTTYWESRRVTQGPLGFSQIEVLDQATFTFGHKIDLYWRIISTWHGTSYTAPTYTIRTTVFTTSNRTTTATVIERTSTVYTVTYTRGTDVVTTTKSYTTTQTTLTGATTGKEPSPFDFTKWLAGLLNIPVSQMQVWLRWVTIGALLLVGIIVVLVIVKALRWAAASPSKEKR
mgnify:CR=1 FL=1